MPLRRSLVVLTSLDLSVHYLAYRILADFLLPSGKVAATEETGSSSLQF
jgi:hypothetical protein